MDGSVVVFVVVNGTKGGYEDAELDGALLDAEALEACAWGAPQVGVENRVKAAIIIVEKCIVVDDLALVC